jgi:hypothetical protein
MCFRGLAFRNRPLPSPRLADQCDAPKNDSTSRSLYTLEREVSADLGSKPSVRDGRIEDMIDINGKDLQESCLSSGGYCVGSVVRVGPRVGTVGETTISKVVYNALVRVLFRAHKDQTGEAPASGTNTRVSNVYSLLQCVGTTRVIENCTA